MINKARGMLLGLAVGDALGTTLEFGPRRALDNLHTEMTGGGVFKLLPGQWTDDTAMAYALGDTLIHNGYDEEEIMKAWVDWYYNGAYSCTGTCFDIGNSTRQALAAFVESGKKIGGSVASGNGSIMRLAPMVLYTFPNKLAITEFSYLQSRLTHSEYASNVAAMMGGLLFDLMHGNRDALNDCVSYPFLRDDISSSGYVKDTFEAAMWVMNTTMSFEDAVIQAVNLGDDADTVGAVVGQLAGALYGVEQIPERWLNNLSWRDSIDKMAMGLFSINNK